MTATVIASHSSSTKRTACATCLLVTDCVSRKMTMSTTSTSRGDHDLGHDCDFDFDFDCRCKRILMTEMNAMKTSMISTTSTISTSQISPCFFLAPSPRPHPHSRADPAGSSTACVAPFALPDALPCVGSSCVPANRDRRRRLLYRRHPHREPFQRRQFRAPWLPDGRVCRKVAAPLFPRVSAASMSL